MASSSRRCVLRVAASDPARLEPTGESRAHLLHLWRCSAGHRSGGDPPSLRAAAGHHPRDLGLGVAQQIVRLLPAASFTSRCRPRSPAASTSRHGSGLPPFLGVALGLSAHLVHLSLHVLRLQLRAITQNRGIASAFGNAARAHRLTCLRRALPPPRADLL